MVPLLLLLQSIGSAAVDDKDCCTASYCAPCCGKDVGDCCTFDTTNGVCTETVGGILSAEYCTLSKNMTIWTRCSLHSRNGNLGCFSPAAKTEPSFVVCETLKRGDSCKVAASKRSSGYTGNCIRHYDHGGLMCVEAVGGSGDCEGLGVGEPCPVGAPEGGKLCGHHTRRGNMMCIVPNTVTDAALVCKEKDKSDFCGYIKDNSHEAKGYFEGVCHPHDEGIMMCVDPDTVDDAQEHLLDKDADEKACKQEVSSSYVAKVNWALVSVSCLLFLS